MSKKKREITAPSISGLVSDEAVEDSEEVQATVETPSEEEKPEVVITEVETPVEKKVNKEKLAEMQKEIQRRRGNYSSAFEQELLARRGQAAPPKRSFEGELARRRKFNR